jgi:hypothetical protein
MRGEVDTAAIENTIKELDNEMDVMRGEVDTAAIENTIKELDDELAMHGEADMAAIENLMKELDDMHKMLLFFFVEMAMYGEADIAAIKNAIKELDNEMDVMHDKADIAAVESALPLAEEMEKGLEVKPGSSKFLRGDGGGGGSGENNANVELDVNFIEAKCLTETDCEEQMSRGYEMFEVGDFPLSGCFAKDNILYWGTGETFDESMDLDAFFQGDGAVEGVFC